MSNRGTGRSPGDSERYPNIAGTKGRNHEKSKLCFSGHRNLICRSCQFSTSGKFYKPISQQKLYVQYHVSDGMATKNLDRLLTQ